MTKTILLALIASGLLLLQGCDAASRKQADAAAKRQEEMRKTLSGTYISEDNLLYRSLTFKGKSTVVITDAFIGMEFPTSYVRDENFIRIKTDLSDLLLELSAPDTLVGEGFIKGCYVKKQ